MYDSARKTTHVFLVATCVFSLLVGCERRKDGADRLQRGKELLGTEPTQALEQYELAEAEGADSIAVKLGKAAALEQLQRIDEAEKLLAEVIEQAPTRLEARLALARIHIDAGRFDEARADVAATLGHTPPHVPSILLLPALVASPADAKRGQVALARMNGPEYNQVRASSEYACAKARLAELTEGTAAAEAVLRDAAESRSLSPQMALALSHAYLKLGAQRYAEWLLTRASADNNAPDYIHGELANVALSLGHLTLAQVAIGKLRTEFAADPDALLLQARLFERQSSARQSAAAAKKALDALPRDAEKGKKLEVAMNAIGRLLKARRYQDALRLTKDLLKEAPEFKPAKIVLASLLVSLEKPDEALELVQPFLNDKGNLEQLHEIRIAALALKGDQSKVDAAAREYVAASEKSARSILMLAKVHEKAGRRAEASKVLLDALEREPSSTALAAALVKGADRSGGLAAGLAMIEKLRARAVQASLDRLEAKLYVRHGRHADAERVYKKVVADNPKDNQSWAELSATQEHQGRLQDAIASLRTLLEGSPYNTLVLVKLGALESRADNPEQARVAYERVLDVEPNSVIALNNLAMLFAGPLQKPGQAVTLARKTLAAAPDNPAAQDTLGWALAQTGDKKNLEESLDLLRQSSRRLRTGDGYLRYARVLIAAGRPGDAIKELESSLLQKEFSERSVATALLAQLRNGAKSSGNPGNTTAP